MCACLYALFINILLYAGLKISVQSCKEMLINCDIAVLYEPFEIESVSHLRKKGEFRRFISFSIFLANILILNS
jgi:hypothetical protein